MYDNTTCRKASLMGSFCMNLAFYRSASKSHCVPYTLDFAKIKSLRGRKRPNVSKPTDPLPVPNTSLEAFFNQDTGAQGASLQSDVAMSHQVQPLIIQPAQHEPLPSTSGVGIEIAGSSKVIGTATCTNDIVAGELGLVISNITTLAQPGPDKTSNVQETDNQNPNTLNPNPQQMLGPSQSDPPDHPSTSDIDKDKQDTSASTSKADMGSSDIGNTLPNLPSNDANIPHSNILKTSGEDITEPETPDSSKSEKGLGRSAANMPPLNCKSI